MSARTARTSTCESMTTRLARTISCCARTARAAIRRVRPDDDHGPRPRPSPELAQKCRPLLPVQLPLVLRDGDLERHRDDRLLRGRLLRRALGDGPVSVMVG